MLDTTHITVYDTVLKHIPVYDTTKIPFIQQDIGIINTDTVIVICTLLTLIALAIITVRSNRTLSKIKYQNTYYSQILQKRLDAYKILEDFTINFVMFNTDNSVSYNSFFESKQKFIAFANQLSACIEQAIWLENNTKFKLDELNRYITDHFPYVNDNTIRPMGAQHFQYFSTYHYELETLIYEDYKTLDNVQKFIKDQKDKTYEQRHFYVPK